MVTSWKGIFSFENISALQPFVYISQMPDCQLPFIGSTCTHTHKIIKKTEKAVRRIHSVFLDFANSPLQCSFCVVYDTINRHVSTSVRHSVGYWLEIMLVIICSVWNSFMGGCEKYKSKQVFSLKFSVQCSCYVEEYVKYEPSPYTPQFYDMLKR